METRARPTSRGRARCVSVRMGRRWEQTAAGPRAGACRLRRVGRRCLAPVGKGRCRWAYSTLFALRAKALQSWRAGSWRVAGKSRASERFAHQVALSARRGTGPPRVSSQGGRRYTPSRKRDASLSRHPFHINRARQARCFTRHIFLPSLFAANIRRVNASKARLSPFPSPPHPPTIPPGERRALPAPAQGSRPLRIPFWGIAPSSRLPSPKTPQATGPCSWACRRLCARPPQAERNAARPPPARGAGLRHHGANGNGRRPCRPAPAQGSRPLRIPFWGNSPRFLTSPVPQTTAGGRPLLVGLPPSTRTIAPNGTHRSRPAPCSWGGSASPWSQRHWPPALPAHEGGQIFVGAQSAKVALQQQGAAYAVAAIAAAQAQ